jgi:tRNA wybutosine-synthesizing protein 3
MSSSRTKHEDASLADELVALEQQWKPIIAENEDVLPSFADIKAKTVRDLYGVAGHDKSPKGSVDVAIRALVSLINIHPSFATLSSCSGRIALFDPHLKHGTTQDDILSDDSSPTITEMETESSGKGHGRWLLASHEPVDPTILAALLEEPGELSEVLMFKHEPLLLHIAASCLTRGRQLLSLALELGFRESGLVVTPHRVTVAIRGYSLALCVPLARRGPLRPSNEYLQVLVGQANQRMRANQEKLRRLQQQVQEELFCPATKTLRATVQSLPALNLWGHAAVAALVGSYSSDYDLDVFVFGGYGEGPDIINRTWKGGNSGGKRCCRSNSVYCLRRCDDVFEDQWRKITLKPVSEDPNEPRVHELIGVKVDRVNFSAREGLGACLLPLNITAIQVVALFGGRASPGKPFNDLLLFETDRGIEDPSFMKPLDIRGKCPEPRWGHSLTTLSGKGGSRDEGGPVAVLIGGRNEQTSFGSVYILSLSPMDLSGNGSRHFYWTKLELGGFQAQFNHTTVVQDDLILVFRGLSDPNQLLESFSDSYRSTHKGSQDISCPISAFRIAGCDTTVKKVNLVKASCENFGMRHGAASCVLTAPDESGTTLTLVAITGGVPFNASETESLVWYQLKSTAKETTLALLASGIQIEAAETIDFGTMVHHCCVPLFSPESYADMILLGGGVSSFAFGASFAGRVVPLQLN